MVVIFMGMLNRARVRRTLAIASSVLAVSESARADFYLHHWNDFHSSPKEFNLGLAAGLYSTSDNYDGGGSRFVPAGLESYKRIQTDAAVSYGFNPHLTAFGRLGWARAELGSTTSPLRGSTFSFTDATVGANYRVLERMHSYNVDLQLQVDLPMYSNNGLTAPALGDATTDITGGAFGSIPALHTHNGTLTVLAGAGYTYRTDSRSSALPWTVAASFAPSAEGFFGSVGGTGQMSLNTDSRATTLTATTPAVTFAPNAGGSFISGAVNPSLFIVTGEAGYRFGEDLAVNAFAAQSVWGQGAPNGFHAGFALKTKFGGSKPVMGNGARMTPMDYGRSNQGFLNYSTEAKVMRVNDRLNLVKLDKGTQDGIAVGQVFDVFMTRKDGNTGETVARGHITAVQSNEAALTVDEYFKEIWIDEGFVAKRPVQ
jgi:hypothetical protein